LMDNSVHLFSFIILEQFPLGKLWEKRNTLSPTDQSHRSCLPEWLPEEWLRACKTHATRGVVYWGENPGFAPLVNQQTNSQTTEVTMSPTNTKLAL
jgi:hypothetical protein